MPRIAEIREIDGAVWCKLEIEMSGTGSAAIYTDDEVRHVRRDAIEGLLEPSDAILDAGWNSQEMDWRDPTSDGLRDVFRAMITQALKE